MNTTLYFSLSLCLPLLFYSFYLSPSRLIPWATHFFRRQLWQRFLLVRSMRQLLCLEQEYCTLEDWLLRKKPYREKDWARTSTNAVNEICSFKVQHYASNYRCRISTINKKFSPCSPHRWWPHSAHLMTCLHRSYRESLQYELHTHKCTQVQLGLRYMVTANFAFSHSNRKGPFWQYCGSTPHPQLQEKVSASPLGWWMSCPNLNKYNQ